MGAGHDAGSQKNLHSLFGDFSDLVGKRIELALTALAADAKRPSKLIRVLDIGAGEVPYGNALRKMETDLHNAGYALDFTMLDKDKKGLETNAWGNDEANKQWKWVDFLEEYKALEDDKHGGLRKQPFDLVIMAATLHELFYDAVVDHNMGLDVHAKILRYIRNHLLAESGYLIVADYAWMGRTSPEDVWRVAQAQRRATKHADPPWAFLPVQSLHEAATLRAGFRFSGFALQPLYDITHKSDKMVEEFSKALTAGGDKLGQSVLNTLATRIGFVATYACRGSQIRAAEEHKQALPVRASLYLSHRAEQLFSDKLGAAGLENALSRLITGPAKELNNQSPLWHFLKAIEQSAHGQLTQRQMSSIGLFELWVSIGLKSMMERRFIPSVPSPWTQENSDQTRRAGALGGIENFVPIALAEGSDVMAGPLSLPYDTILAHAERPSLHGWFCELHKVLREHFGNHSLFDSEQCRKDLPKIHSLTILKVDSRELNNLKKGAAADPHADSQLDERKNRGATSLSLTSLWGDDSKQVETGHYLLILEEDSPDKPVEQLAKCLERIARAVFGENIQNCAYARHLFWDSVQQSFYKTWLEAVFETSDDAGAPSEAIKVDRAHFSQYMKRQNLPLPKYRAYTTIALGCDGLSTSQPDTVMLFSEIPFPPAVLDRVDDMMFDACRRLGQSEEDALLKAETSSSVTETMLTSFGHDGKRPAAIVRLLLRQREDSARILALYAANSLLERLESYSRIDVRNLAASIVFTGLKSEIPHTKEWITVQSLWEREALSQVIRICVDEGVWRDIRDHGIFPVETRQFAWVDLEGIFSQLLTACQSFPKRLPREIVIAANRDAVQRCAQLPAPINIVYDGPQLQCPISLDGRKSTPTVPKLATVLGFVFSELMTNAAKHIWKYLCHENSPVNIPQLGLRYALKVSEERDGYYFEACFAPSSTQIPCPHLEGVARTTTGLTSIKLALRSIGTAASESDLVWKDPESGNSNKLGSLPFPVHDEKRIKGHQTTWTVSRFGPLAKELFRLEP